jgi:hypothetical protein
MLSGSVYRAGSGLSWKVRPWMAALVWLIAENQNLAFWSAGSVHGGTQEHGRGGGITRAFLALALRAIAR